MRILLILALLFIRPVSSSTRAFIAPQIQSMNQQSCIIGNPNIRIYADQIVNPDSIQEDSFLKDYWKHKFLSSLPTYAHKSSFKDRIPQERIACSIQNIPFIETTKLLCNEGSSLGIYSNDTPCITQEMIHYIHWTINEALRCFSDDLDKYSKSVLYKKVHLESSFGFFFKSKNGTGLTQLVGVAKEEMFHHKNSGNTYLENYIFTHPQQCSHFVGLMERSKKINNFSNCDFISMKDGMARNILGGLGLFMYYRSAPENSRSAEKLLDYWGYHNNHSNTYYQIRNTIALGMFNKGSNAVFAELQNKFQKNSLKKMSESKRFSMVSNQVNKSSFAGYIHGMENRLKSSFDQNGQCLLSAKSTSGGLAYRH